VIFLSRVVKGSRMRARITALPQTLFTSRVSSQMTRYRLKKLNLMRFRNLVTSRRVPRADFIPRGRLRGQGGDGKKGKGRKKGEPAAGRGR